jgi:uncharacterized protein YbbK (DUF523 family)
MKPAHFPSAEFFASLPEPSPERPLKILVSGCLGGLQCVYDGTGFGSSPLDSILAHPNSKPVFFCPEDFAVGTPRELSNIHGGNGFDVLDGRARVLTESGEDWTEAMKNAAGKMLEIAQQTQIDLAILLDISAACGSQVIYSGHRTQEEKVYQKGPGVCAALLIRNHFPMVSHRDYATLELIKQTLDKNYVSNPDARDHHETEWYGEYFKNTE